MRDLDALIPIVRDKAMAFKLVCANHGIHVVIISTLRLDAEQEALYAQGREPLDVVNALRKIVGMSSIAEKANRYTVTNTRDSIHLYGCAFDFAVLGPKGISWDVKADINADNFPDYQQAGIIGESLGLTWGGRFKSLYDAGHLEYTDGLDIEDLKQGARPGYNF